VWCKERKSGPEKGPSARGRIQVFELESEPLFVAEQIREKGRGHAVQGRTQGKKNKAVNLEALMCA